MLYRTLYTSPSGTWPRLKGPAESPEHTLTDIAIMARKYTSPDFVSLAEHSL